MVKPQYIPSKIFWVIVIGLAVFTIVSWPAFLLKWLLGKIGLKEVEHATSSQ